MEKQLGDTPSELERLRELLGQRDAELKKRETRMGELSDESFKFSEQAKNTELRAGCCPIAKLIPLDEKITRATNTRVGASISCLRTRQS